MDNAGRAPVHSLEMERAVLCCCIVDGGRIAAIPRLRADHFYDPRHRALFETILEMQRQSKPVDILTLNDELEATGAMEKAGGGAYFLCIFKLVWYLHP